MGFRQKFITCSCHGYSFDTEEECLEHERQYEEKNKTGIDSKPYIEEYEVLPEKYGDYADCRVKNSNTGRIVIDGEVANIKYFTNIVSFGKLIGKKIRVTSYAEIINDSEVKNI